ncbi:MAG: hypothetical protein IJ760_08495 [Bacteroidales bacterium]|nr:hypothetical protein [Bacteroidales bacterium]
MKHLLEIDTLQALEGWAFVHFRTYKPLHVFVHTLNKLYNINLRRIDDLQMGTDYWPLFHSTDSRHELMYCLLEKNSSDKKTPWENGDKLLIVHGQQAEVEADYICSDISDPLIPPPGDLLAQEHYRLVESMMSDFTLPTVLNLAATASSHRAQKELNNQQQLCNIILSEIERRNLDLTTEELLRRRFDETRRRVIQEMKNGKNNFAEK